jgi:hypothetical protein
MKKKQSYLQEHRAYMKKRFKEIKDKKAIIIMFVLFFGLLAFMGFASAAPPVTTVTTSDRAITIEHPLMDPLITYTDYKFHFHIYNSTNGEQIIANSSVVTCSFHLYNQTGSHIFKNNYAVGSDDVLDYEQIIKGGNFSSPGTYSYVFQCNSTALDIGGFYNHDVTVVTAQTTNQSLTLFLVLLLSSIVFFIGGYILDQDWLVFLSGILWVITGIYSMIYGISNMTNLYTRAIAGVTLVIGIVLIIASILNISGGSNSEEE